MRIPIKAVTLYLFALGAWHFSYSQVEPIWINNSFTECKKSEASHYIVIEPIGESYGLAMYDVHGNLKMKGECQDEKGEVFHGDFEFYHSNGMLESKGRYIHDAKVDVWDRYDQRGIALAERYYAAFDARHMAYTYVDEMPRFEGGKKKFQDFLKQKFSSLVNETEFRENALKLEVGFVIKEDGIIEGIEFIKGLDPDWDLKALHTLGTLPAWIPGKKSGEEVRVYVRLPIELSR